MLPQVAFQIVLKCYIFYINFYIIVLFSNMFLYQINIKI